MSYPEQPYQVSAIATYPDGIERELVEHGDPCTELLNVAPGRRSALMCSALPTYLQGGTPRCKEHLSKLCKHGEYSHMLCKKYFYPLWVHRLHKPRAQTS